MSNEESISSIAYNISYEKLIKLDEKQYEEILRIQNSTQKVTKIANDCIKNLEKNILKNILLLFYINKISNFKEIEKVEPTIFEDLFNKFKKELLEYEENKDSISKSIQDDKDKTKNGNSNTFLYPELINKKLEIFKMFVKIQAELNSYSILKELIKDHNILGKEEIAFFNKFLDEFKNNKDLFNKGEVILYEVLILQFNHLENNLDYKTINIEIDDFNFEINLQKEIKDIKYLNDFIRSFSKQKDKSVTKEMEIFIFKFYNSNKNLNTLFNNCNMNYLNESYDYSKNAISSFPKIL